MYLIGIIVFAAALLVPMSFSGFTHYYDLPSIFIIATLTFSALLSAGLLRDFIRAFRLMGAKVNGFTAIELKRSLQAINVAILMTVVAGLFCFFAGAISIFISLTDTAKLGEMVSVTFISPLYSCIDIMILLPVRAKVKTVLSAIE